MKIEKANTKDLPAILALQKKCYLSEAEIYNDFTIPPLTQTLQSIEEDFSHQTFFKVVSNGEIIGSVRALVDNDTCKIGRLIVDNTFQNQGIGKRLMSKIESHFSHVRRFELFTGHKSIKNVSFYKKLGYTAYDHKVINTGLSLIFMEKKSI